LIIDKLQARETVPGVLSFFMKRLRCGFWVVVFCVLNIIFRIIFIDIPAHLDEMYYLDGVSAIIQNHLNPFVEFWGYKPPLMFWIPAALSYFVGPNYIIPRLFIYLCSSLLLYFVYLIARDVFKNERVGLWSVLILFFYPIFTVQSFVFQDTIPTSLFFTMSFYFLFTNKRKWYILSSICLVMTRELGVIPIGIFLLFDVFVYKKGLLNSIKLHLPSLIVFGLWMLLNKHFLGWYLWPVNVNWKNSFDNPNYIFGFIGYIYYIILFWLVSLIDGKNKREKILVLVVFLINFIITIKISFSHRYHFHTTPIIILMFIQSVYSLKNKNLFLIFIFICFLHTNIEDYIIEQIDDIGDNNITIINHSRLIDKTLRVAYDLCANNCVYVVDYYPMYGALKYNYKSTSNYCYFNEDLDKCLIDSIEDKIVYVLSGEKKILSSVNPIELYETNIFNQDSSRRYYVFEKYK